MSKRRFCSSSLATARSKISSTLQAAPVSVLHKMLHVFSYIYFNKPAARSKSLCSRLSSKCAPELFSNFPFRNNKTEGCLEGCLIKGPYTSGTVPNLNLLKIDPPFNFEISRFCLINYVIEPLCQKKPMIIIRPMSI